MSRRFFIFIYTKTVYKFIKKNFYLSRNSCLIQIYNINTYVKE